MVIFAFALPLLLDLLWPSRMWNFDGVACAAALELGNPVFYFHSNHLLYGFLGYGFWKLVAPFGLNRALPALQMFTSLLAAGGLLGLYKTLAKIPPHPPFAKGGVREDLEALLLTLCVAVTAVFWVWSIEAQVYALGFLAIAWATYWLFRTDHPHHWRWAALSHGLAILGHVMHILWVIPALYWLRKGETNLSDTVRRKNLKEYALWLAGGVILPYAWVIGCVILPHTHQSDRSASSPWLAEWLLGSAALGPGRMFQWHLAGWAGPFQWAATSLRVFWGTFWPYQNLSVPGWCWGLTVFSVLGFAVLFVNSIEMRQRNLWRFGLLWLMVYGLFFWTWEPQTECYRMTDVVPIAIIMALGLQKIQSWPARITLLTLLLVATGAVNFSTRIRPMNEIGRNLVYQQTLELSQKTPPNSLYLMESGQPWLYLLYFSGRQAWNIRAFAREPARLERAVAERRGHVPIYIQASVLQSGFIQSWLSHYKRQPLEGNLPWAQLL